MIGIQKKNYWKYMLDIGGGVMYKLFFSFFIWSCLEKCLSLQPNLKFIHFGTAAAEVINIISPNAVRHGGIRLY